MGVLDGRVVIVTGAGRRSWAVLTLELARKGPTIVAAHEGSLK